MSISIFKNEIACISLQGLNIAVFAKMLNELLILITLHPYSTSTHLNAKVSDKNNRSKGI